MEFILHIGTEKTGTSTLQSMLKINRRRLLQQGIALPKSLRPFGRGANQMVLPALFSDHRARELLQQQSGQHSDEDTAAFEQRIAEAFTAELKTLAAAGINKVLVSSEHLSSRLHSFESIQALKTWLTHFGRVSRIMVYLRRQDEFFISTYSTDIKSGACYEFSPPPSQVNLQRYDYWQLLQHWEQVFGPEILALRVYEKSQLVGGDIVSDFCQLLGIDTAGFVRKADRNLSLDPSSLAILRSFNQWQQERGHVDEDLRRRLIRLLEERAGQDRLSWSLAQREQYINLFTASNQRVAQHYFQREELFTEAPKPDSQACMLPANDMSLLWPLLGPLLQPESPAFIRQTAAFWQRLKDTYLQ